MSRPRMSTAELLDLPVMVDVPTAGRAFGFGRNGSYELARTGQFPVTVHEFGHRKRVVRADILAALGVEDTQPDQPDESTPASAA